MNMSKSEIPDLIDRRPTARELKLDWLMGVRPYVSINSSFQWCQYGNDVLISLMSRTKKGAAVHERGCAASLPILTNWLLLYVRLILFSVGEALNTLYNLGAR
jgi:hypothetical protein